MGEISKEKEASFYCHKSNRDDESGIGFHGVFMLKKSNADWPT